MAELTSNEVNEVHEVAGFIEQVASYGVWLPVPQYEIGRSLTFHFNEWEVPTVPGESVWTLSSEERAKRVLSLIRNAVKAIGGTWKKNDPNESHFDDMYYVLTSETKKPGGIELRLLVDRYLNCERKQVGTKQVVVPAQEATEETVIEEPVFERICHPLFRGPAAEIEGVTPELESVSG